jgi:hypothetical protein
VVAFLGIWYSDDPLGELFQPNWYLSEAKAYIGFMLAIIALLANIVCLIKIYPKEKAESNQ